MTKKVSSTGRFGARYGKRIRQKVIDIEKKQRVKQKCPYCNKIKVKRLSFGIFKCRSCDSKFTGKAYFVKWEPINVSIAEVVLNQIKLKRRLFAQDVVVKYSIKQEIFWQR